MGSINHSSFKHEIDAIPVNALTARFSSRSTSETIIQLDRARLRNIPLATEWRKSGERERVAEERTERGPRIGRGSLPNEETSVASGTGFWLVPPNVSRRSINSRPGSRVHARSRARNNGKPNNLRDSELGERAEHRPGERKKGEAAEKDRIRKVT